MIFVLVQTFLRRLYYFLLVLITTINQYLTTYFVKFAIMRYLLTIFAFIIFNHASGKTNRNLHQNLNYYGHAKSLKDTCVLGGFTFKIIDYKSGRNLHATIKNGEIKIINEGVQFFKYRVIYYVFSSLDDARIPVVRIFDGRVAYRVLKVLEQSRVGGQYIFEDIIVVDPSGIKLDNEVRSILIERVK